MSKKTKPKKSVEFRRNRWDSGSNDEDSAENYVNRRIQGHVGYGSSRGQLEQIEEESVNTRVAFAKLIRLLYEKGQLTEDEIKTLV